MEKFDIGQAFDKAILKSTKLVGVMIDPHELQTICKALLETSTAWEEAGSSFSGYDKYICNHCGEVVEDQSSRAKPEPQQELQHKPDCVTHLARSLLETHHG